MFDLRTGRARDLRERGIPHNAPQIVFSCVFCDFRPGMSLAGDGLRGLLRHVEGLAPLK